MASKIKVELNRTAVRNQLLKSDEMREICSEKAQEIANRCGSGYTHDTYTGRNRVNAMVYADSYKAIADNAKNNTILKALGR